MNATASETSPMVNDAELWAGLDELLARDEVELNRREHEDEVTSHLLWAGMELKRARVAADGEITGGWLHTPDLDLGVIGFTPHETAESPAPGTPVRVAYGRGPDAYTFESILVDEDDGTWLLDIPTAIGARGQRMTERQLACGAWFLLIPEGDDEVLELELHDLSVGGVGILTGPGDVLRGVGERLMGSLYRVDGFLVPVVAEVRHVSRLADHPEWLVTGCVLRFGAELDREMLARALAE